MLGEVPEDVGEMRRKAAICRDQSSQERCQGNNRQGEVKVRQPVKNCGLTGDSAKKEKSGKGRSETTVPLPLPANLEVGVHVPASGGSGEVWHMMRLCFLLEWVGFLFPFACVVQVGLILGAVLSFCSTFDGHLWLPFRLRQL